MTADPDHATIDRVLAGEQQVYALLVDKHKRYALSIALRILQSRSEAEEAAQDAFVKAYHHLAAFNRQSKFSTWLYRIVFNTAISYRRKNRIPLQHLEPHMAGERAAAEGNLENDDKKKFLEQALAKLTEADRTAITLFYLNEFSLEEIATITGMQANTAKVRIHRARQRLADELKEILNHEALTL